MIVLALDTCLAACSAAVLVERAGVAAVTGRIEARRTGHAEALPDMIAACARAAGIALRDVTRIAVTRGPGTFTGVRVGISAARALALATGAPIVATTSLALVAATALAADPALGAGPHRTILVAVPGPQAWLYVQTFDRAGRAITEACACESGRAIPALELDTIVIGPAARGISAVAAAQGHAAACAAEDVLPDARVLATMAPGLEAVAGPLMPLYLRPPDAKPQDGRSLPRMP